MATINDYPVKLVNGDVQSVIIPAGENYSNAFNLVGTTLVGLSIPAASYTGAGGFVQVGFYASIDGKNDPYELLVDGSNSGTRGIGIYFGDGGGEKIPLSPAVFVGMGNIKLYIFQTQSFDVEIKLLLAPILQ